MRRSSYGKQHGACPVAGGLVLPRSYSVNWFTLTLQSQPPSYGRRLRPPLPVRFVRVLVMLGSSSVHQAQNMPIPAFCSEVRAASAAVFGDSTRTDTVIVIGIGAAPGGGRLLQSLDGSPIGSAPQLSSRQFRSKYRKWRNRRELCVRATRNRSTVSTIRSSPW